MKDRVKFTIEAVRVDGRPMEPKKAADKFVRQARVLVRDQIPIIIEYWNKPKKDDGTFVDERSKETLRNSLLVNFTLPPKRMKTNRL